MTSAHAAQQQRGLVVFLPQGTDEETEDQRSEVVPVRSQPGSRNVRSKPIPHSSDHWAFLQGSDVHCPL